MPRLFVGLALPQDTQDALWRGFTEARGQMPDAKWVASENIHLTLAFLGQVGEDRVKGVTTALGEAAVHATAFSLRIRGTGAFPSPRRGRVIWAGIEAPSELSALKHVVDRSLEPHGFEMEKHRFHAHVTMARLRVTADVSNALGSVEGSHFEDRLLRVDRFVLFESHLSPRGARYAELASFSLAGC